MPPRVPRGISVTIQGTERVVSNLKAVAARAKNVRPALQIVADLLQALAAEAVRTRGGVIGHRWAPLAPSTVKARQRGYGYYAQAPGAGVNSRTPLVWTGGMIHSFVKGDPYNVRRITSTSLEWGSSHPIVGYHNSRAPRFVIPFRPILGFSGEAQKRTITVEPLEMWMRGVGVPGIRATAFGRSGLVFRRAG